MLLPRRRTVLLGGALGSAALTAGCTSHPKRTPPRVDPDVALTAAAVTREQALLAAYDAALAHAPGLAAKLGPLRAEHAAHLAALSATAPMATAPPAAAVSTAALVRLERSTAAAHAAAALTASTRLAPLLASLAAAESTHAVLL